MPQTRAQLRATLSRVEREYDAALAEIAGKPDGNEYATQDEMRAQVGTIYGMTILSIQRKLEFGLNWPNR
jgi:hypothetical protein